MFSKKTISTLLISFILAAPAFAQEVPPPLPDQDQTQNEPPQGGPPQGTPPQGGPPQGGPPQGGPPQGGPPQHGALIPDINESPEPAEGDGE